MNNILMRKTSFSRSFKGSVRCLPWNSTPNCCSKINKNLVNAGHSDILLYASVLSEWSKCSKRNQDNPVCFKVPRQRYTPRAVRCTPYKERLFLSAVIRICTVCKAMLVMERRPRPANAPSLNVPMRLSKTANNYSIRSVIRCSWPISYLTHSRLRFLVKKGRCLTLKYNNNR